MTRRIAVLLLLAAIDDRRAAAARFGRADHWPVRRAWYYDWNKHYANTAYGQPVSLVVPPTATMQTN